jgi:hypothetical protein
MNDQDLLADLGPIEAHVFNLPAPPNLDGFEWWVSTWAIELIAAGTPWDLAAAVGLLYRAADKELPCRRDLYIKRADAWCDSVRPEDREMLWKIAAERIIDLRVEVAENADNTEALNDIEIRISEAAAVLRCLDEWGILGKLFDLMEALDEDFLEVRPF